MRMTVVALVGLILGGCASRAPIVQQSGPDPTDPEAPTGSPSPSVGVLDPASAQPLDAPMVQSLQAVPSPSPSGGALAGHPADAHATDGPAPVGPADALAGVVYVCPMHPEITSDKPDQRCPKCGMRLVPRREGGSR